MSQSATEAVRLDRPVVHTYRCQEFESVLYEGELLYEVDEQRRVATITFHRPERLNAMPLGGLDYLTSLIKRAEEDDRVKVIVLRGSGPCFGVGGDANELGSYIGLTVGSDGRPRRPFQHRRMLPDRDVVFGSHGFEQAILRCFKATVCQVHGYCYGAHLMMAVAADVVVASDDALFVHPAWRYLGPLFNFPLLIETVGLKKAKEMVLTCRPLGANEAERFGLVTRVVGRDDLEKITAELVDAIALRPIDGIAMGKAMLEQAMEVRGAGMGGLIGWAGHAWLTNLKFEPEEFNFVKARREEGLTKALAGLDRLVAPEFRMGEARSEAQP